LGKFPHEIDEMPHEDFVAFLIKHKLSPIGSLRDDIRHAHSQHLLMKVNSDPKKFNAKPEHYQLFKFKKPAKPMTDEEIEAAVCATLDRLPG